jgi:hypothetical protein
MPTISSMFAISKITAALDADGQPQDESLIKHLGSFLDELEWYEEALKRQRDEKGKPF